jgi:hypothetical protein
MREAQGNILLQDPTEGSADLKKIQQQGGLVFTETRPRQFAALMLKDLRAYCSKRMDELGVPQELRGQTMSHVISAVSKAKYRRKVK